MRKTVDLTTGKRERILLIFILFLALIFYSIFIYRTRFSIKGETYFTLVDDAMVSMRYAKNLANGFGLVWNVTKPPVEGFTNLGWTLYMAVLHKFPVSEAKLSLFVMITSAFLLLGIAYISFKLIKTTNPQLEKAPIIAAAVTAFYYPLVYWSLRGMEVGIATLLVYWLAMLAMTPSKPITTKRALMIGLMMLFAILVRFDTVLQVTLILGYILYASIKQKVRVPTISLVVFFYLAAVIGISLFQYFYFGSIFPNTYYLKVVGTTLQERMVVGIQVFVEYATRDFLTPLFIAIAGFIFFPSLREKKYFLLLALFFIQCGYSIYVGGDYAEPLSAPHVTAANRFITQGMPSVIILFSIVIDHFLQTIPVKTGSKYALMLILGISLSTTIIMSGANWFKWTLKNAPMLDSDISRARLGIQLREDTDKNTVIAVHAAGQIPYYSNLQTIDLLGKSDPVVAMGLPSTSFRPGHNKWNYEYSIMELQPDLVADEWGQLRAFLSNKPSYYRLENGIWVRKDSAHLNIDALKQYQQ